MSEPSSRERIELIYETTMLNPEAIYTKLLAAGEDWADKKAAAELLEETKKSVLSQQKVKLGTDKSDAAAETLALCSQDYRVHVASMVEARRQADRAKVLYDSLNTLMELRRSEEATRRSEMNIR